MLTFLEVNGIKLEAENAEVENLGIWVASGKINYQEILDWILSHKTN